MTAESMLSLKSTKLFGTAKAKQRLYQRAGYLQATMYPIPAALGAGEPLQACLPTPGCNPLAYSTV